MQTFNEENRKSSPSKWNKKEILKNINIAFKIIKQNNKYKDEKKWNYAFYNYCQILKKKEKEIVVLFAICVTKLQ